MRPTHQITRRKFLQIGGAGTAGAALLGTQACSNSTGSTGSTGTKTIDWFGNPYPLTKNAYEPTMVEKTFGVKLITYSVNNGDYATKLESLLAGGHIPDIMVINDPNIFQKYAAQGVLAPVPRQTIAQHAPHLYADMNAHWKVAWNYSLYQGKSYGYATSYPTGVNSSLTEWRKDLLAKAGITKAPDTLAEFEAAFAELHKMGVYGMSTTGASYYAQFMTIFGAYGVMPTAWQLIDGKVINGAVAPQAKEALALLAKWYKKGYIDTEFMTNQTGAQQQKFAAGKVAMWDYGNWADTDASNPDSMLAAVRKSDPKGEIIFGYPPKGPGGRGSWAWGPGGWSVVFGKPLQNDPAKLRRILHIVDQIDANNTLGTKLQMGTEGTMYKLTNPTKGLAGGWAWTGKYTNLQTQQQNGIGTTPPAIGQPSWTVETNAAWSDPTQHAIATNYGRYGVYDLFGKTGVVPGSGQYLADLQDLKIRTYAAIITGARPISSFDTFIEQWNTAGGKQLGKAAESFYQQNH